ncbi:non-ribosomal peptide synthetase [Pseudomonas dryadis]|uniref:Non-ribosomal peptide synthetase n=2 Tax=Phytopseudomonas dryadis TaxID=2487520 RepID=A0A4Q9QX74_9GAMM|nr:non-ribosomal peptide synthetase [Pseudomonas dryadis]
MSSLQQGILFHSLQQESSDPYFYQFGFDIEGRFDPALFNSAWEQVARHYQVLRTNYRWEEVETPLQIVFKTPLMDIEVVDLQGASAADAEAAIERILQAVKQAGYDFRQGSPVALKVFVRSAERWNFHWSFHHISLDGWSVSKVLGDLLQCYEALLDGKVYTISSSLPYTRYIQWVHEQDKAALDAHWRATLAGFDEKTPLPLIGDYSDTRYAERPVLFSREDSELIRGAARAHGVTVNTLVQAAWGLLLIGYSQAEEVLFGVTTSGRSAALPGLQTVVGLCINTLPLRIAIDPQLDIGQWLRQIQAQSAESREFEFSSLPELVKYSDLPEGDSLFDSILVFENYPIDEALKQAPAGLRIRQLGDGREHVEEEGVIYRGGRNNYAISVIANLSDQLELTLAYHCQHYSDNSVAELAHQLKHHMMSLARSGSQPLGRLTGLTTVVADTQQQVLAGCKQVFADHDFLALWRQSVTLWPDRLALVHEGRGLDYAALDQHSNQLAHYLLNQGIGVGSTVALCYGRTLEWVISLLAVLKCGATYLPLDHQQPVERLQQLLQDSAAALLIHAADEPKVAQLSGCPTLAYDVQRWSSFGTEPLAVTVHPLQAAYTIYTSGSTGQPKGVVVSHQALANYLQAVYQRLDLPSHASMALVSTVAADLGHTLLFGALASGCPLHLLSYEHAFDPDLFAQYMVEHRIDVLKIVPSHLLSLMQAANAADVLPERALIVGGEACSWALVEKVRMLKSHCRIINHYGPTETTVGVSTHEVAERLADSHSVPIGLPLNNVHALIFDTYLNPVPQRVAGELYIGGETLAQGYLGRPAATAERFIPTEDGKRLYRTGDRVRMTREALPEFMGRADDQVKIRGYRVEPGEVGQVLKSLQGVREVTVLALPLESEDSRLQLVAYCAVEPGITAEHLLPVMKGYLPEHLVPAQIILVERLPLTANGKLDTRALPKPGAVKQQYVAPTNEIEEILASVWGDVLRLEQVGITDNFFDLGGDSILSLQIIARSKRKGLKLTPKQLFEKQTIAQLAQVAKWAEVKAAAAPVSTEQIRGIQPLLPIQMRFFATAIPERHHWNQSILLQPHTRLDVAGLNLALQALYTQHDALRLAFKVESGQWCAQYQASVPGELLWTPPALASAEQIEVLAEQAQRSLNLEQGVLLRAVLMELPQGQQRLLLVIHHCVVDGVSWRVLLEDLQSAYAQAARGEPVKLPDKGTSLQAWGKRLQVYAHSETLKAELGYWQSCLQGSAIDLPCDSPQGGLGISLAQVVSTRLDQALTHKLLKIAPKAYRTQVNDLLLTALSRVLCRWCEQSSVAIQLEGHGREALFDELDISRTTGWFTSLFPVKLTPAADLDGSIKQVKEQLRQLPNKGIGYGLLRYCGDADSQSALAALAEPRITFNYLGQFDGDFAADQGALFVPAFESAGAARSPLGELGNWLSVNGQVYGGELELSWTFSQGMYRAETVQVLADDYGRELAALIEHCCSAQHYGVTPSDFNLVTFNQAQLELLPVAAQDITDIYPLSPMQQGILFHALHEPQGPAYINQLRVDVRQLDADRFHQAWQQTLNAHEILRTAFVWPQGMNVPVQIVLDSVQMPWVIHDWQCQGNLEQALDQLASEDLAAGFELDLAPLLRVILVRTGASDYHLIYTSHHILMDGWSTSQLFGEVLQRYAGQAPAAPQGRYRDYIEWLIQRDAQASQGFWKQALANLQEPTRLANALGPQQVLDQGYADYGHLFSATLTSALNGFAREQKVTFNTLMQAAWLLLLQRYTGQETVAFGATVAGRPTDLAGVEQQIGLFINTLPVVAMPLPEVSVARWIQQVQDLNLALREHEHTPLYDIQRWGGVGGDALFDSILVFENYPMSEALGQGAGPDFLSIRLQEQTNYPLTLVAITGHELSLNCSFDRSYFDEASIRRLACQLESLMCQFMADAQRPLGALELLYPEQRQMALAWSRSPDRPLSGPGVVEQIALQAQANPQAVAILFADQQLDYATLDAQANRLAHKLRAMGVGPEVRVGVCLRRTPQMIISLLAILKAGGAYVPLDPEYPQERLLHMLDDSHAAVLLAEAPLLEVLPPVLQAQIVLVEQDPQWLREWPQTCPEVQTSPANLAYVIYTSGSTGKPKGVAISHGNLAALVQWSLDTYSRDTLNGVLASTSICFDLSVWEIFVTLAGGGFMVLADNALALAELPAREQVRLINTVPSAAAALQRAGQIPASVKVINLAGEPLKQGLVDSLYASTAVERVYDLYGPSEDTTYSTFTLRTRQGPANIGRPLENTAAYLLDNQLQVLPAGVAAELYLGGAGVSRGYLMRASLTAERFVPNLYANNGERLYRTGDLVRQGADGNIEYIGRADHQVKIRGFRIELNEIEAQLLEQDEVREAVVLAQDGVAGKHLHAYVVAAQPVADSGALLEGLRAALTERLPAHMLPGQLHLIEAIPLTPNGKLDRKALMALGDSPTQRYEAPETELQWEVATIWQEVLEVERVGLMDNFFQLGGHSLLATLVVTRIKERLGDKVALKELFETDSLKAFCSRIESLRIEMSPVQDELAKSLEALKRLSPDDLEKLIS